MSNVAASESSSGPERDERSVGMLVNGSYRLLRRIGGGGIGEVYEAEHERLGRRVAVKLLRRELAEGKVTRLRFRQEARLLASLECDHVVGVLDRGELPDGTAYLAMELLRGEDLRDKLARVGRLSVDEAVRLGSEACLGLEAVHAAGILHRDLKPANLFLAERAGGSYRCKILDFGTAKAIAASDLTRQGSRLGTLRYMAPEQVSGESAVDARADLYALGAILYEALAGAPPHRGETLEELALAIANRSPVPLHELDSRIPLPLSRIVMRCLARAPDERFDDARALLDELRALGAAERPFPLAETAPDLEDDAVRTRARPAPGRLVPALAGFVLGALAATAYSRTQEAEPAAPNTAQRPAAEARAAPAPEAAGVEEPPPSIPAVTGAADEPAAAAPPKQRPRPRAADTASAAPKPAQPFEHLLDLESPYTAPASST
ncbi:MAG TPA: serine/threonine-protein kinase, partial [Polyangiaceae bacterium]